MLGDLLRETREQKKLSLEDVEQGTNIRKLYIKSIEDGDYDKLPGEVFLKGFIKTYGKFLGLNSLELIEQYKKEKNASASEKEVEPTNQVQEQPVSPAQPPKVEEKITEPTKEKNIPKIDSFASNQAYLQPTKSNSKKNIFLVIIILIVIIGGAVFFLSSQDTSDTKAPVHTTQQESTQQPEQQAQQPAPAPVVNGAEVTAVFNEDCWTEVKVDGNVVLSETVKKGSNLNWKGNNQIDITVGNAGAIDITFNNQPVGKLGDIGAVVTKSFVAPNAQNAQNQQPATAQPQNPAPANNAQNAPATNAQNATQQQAK
jgi:cytoskeletal protein RodZ